MERLRAGLSRKSSDGADKVLPRSSVIEGQTTTAGTARVCGFERRRR